jgi:RNA polymerase sigma-70 factor (ECF subfamily)
MPSSNIADVIELCPAGGEHDPRAIDAALVEAARAGDRAARQSLFRRHARRVNELALRLAPRPDEADDIVQDAFVHALDQLGRLREPRAFSGWLRTIVVSTAAKRLRRHRLRVRLGLARREPIEFEALAASTAPPAVVAELRELYAQLDRLPSEARVALVLRRIEGMTVKEVATHMNASTSTVKRRLRQAEAILSELRGELDDG